MEVNLKDFYQSNKIISDYLSACCNHLYRLPFSKDSIIQSAQNKSFSVDKRRVLVDALNAQYEGENIHSKTKENIEALMDENTFTITTGHQLNIFTGPMFFMYKILQVINITEELNKEKGGNKFVPVFWMASEDHDFDEIASVNVFQDKLTWEKNPGDAVGRMEVSGLKNVLDQIKSKFRELDSEVFEVLENYISKGSLAKAALYFTNYLFGKYGLVVLDADSKDLKKVFSPIMKEEILTNTIHDAVKETIDSFDDCGYKTQVNPREINLFYLNDGHRGRFVKEGDSYKIANSSIEFSQDDLLKELESNPERFSPNVVMRPMYQETILPNIAYLGGAGEIGYWLEFKNAFEKVNVDFPILIVRNSLLLVDKNSNKKLKKLNLPLTDFLKKEDEIVRNFVKNNSEDVDLITEIEQLNDLKVRIEDKANTIDASLKQSVGASFSKFEKELGKIESKFLKSLKQKSETEINAIKAVKSKFYPHGVFQERYENVVPYFVTFGFEFTDILKENIAPFQQKLQFVDLEQHG